MVQVGSSWKKKTGPFDVFFPKYVNCTKSVSVNPNFLRIMKFHVPWPLPTHLPLQSVSFYLYYEIRTVVELECPRLRVLVSYSQEQKTCALPARSQYHPSLGVVLEYIFSFHDHSMLTGACSYSTVVWGWCTCTCTCSCTCNEVLHRRLHQPIGVTVTFVFDTVKH